MWGKKKKQVVYPSIYKDRYKDLIKQTLDIVNSMEITIDLLEFKIKQLQETIHQKY